MVAFDPVPESLALVDYAPNHVRAWTREAYGKAGGHDPSRPVCDDHDLVVRTFLSGARMERVDECLYLYRVHARNTVKERNAAIRAATHSIYNERIEDIVLKWASGRRLPRYDLGGGHNPRPGWIPVDVEGATVAADLRGRWPWPDSSVGAFRAYDFLEHLPDKVHTMSEIHRCLVPGGWLLSLTPSALGNGAFMDPTHCSMWVRASFWYFTKSAFAEYIRNSCVRFREQRLLEYFPSEWHKTENIPYICADLVAVKDGYEGPGPHEWV